MHHAPRNVLGARAAAMRAFPTFSEAALWEVLKGSRLGVAFRRRKPDEQRDRVMARLGWRVVRVEAGW